MMPSAAQVMLDSECSDSMPSISPKCCCYCRDNTTRIILLSEVLSPVRYPPELLAPASPQVSTLQDGCMCAAGSRSPLPMSEITEAAEQVGTLPTLHASVLAALLTVACLHECAYVILLWLHLCVRECFFSNSRMPPVG